MSLFNQSKGPYFEIGFTPFKSKLTLAFSTNYFKGDQYNYFFPEVIAYQQTGFTLTPIDTFYNVTYKESYSANSYLLNLKIRLNENKKIALYVNTGLGSMTLKKKEQFTNFMISTQNNINHFFSFQAGLGFGIPIDKSNDIQIRGEFIQGVTFSNIQATDIDIPRYSRGNYSFIQTRLGMSWRL